MIKDHKFEYGGYCIGFDKQWGVKKQLQPVIYYNELFFISKCTKNVL